MQKLFNCVVEKKKYVLLFMIACSLLCAVLSTRVFINADMTRYLPEDSRMKQGMDIMAEEFTGLSMPSTIRVMFRGLPDERHEEFRRQILAVDGVDTAVLTGMQDDCVLFTVSTSYHYRTPEELKIEQDLRERFADYSMTMCNDDTTGMKIPAFIYVIAVVLLFAVMFVMCRSWAEPFLFLAAIGMAILINMGTNLVLGSVSQTTDSISSVLQLVLSMDYSIILMNRYRQEKESGRGADRNELMKRALSNAFPSIASSSFTTLAGLIMLTFMRFKIGRDIGLVLAKGVFWSMVCVVTALPGLILYFDKWIEKSAKPSLHIPTGSLAAFAFRRRNLLAVGFICLFGISWYLQSKSETSYSLHAEDAIESVFPSSNPIVVLYENTDEDKMQQLAVQLEADPSVESVTGYSTTLGRQRTSAEMFTYLKEMMEQSDMELEGMDLNRNTISLVYSLYALSHGGNPEGTLSLEELFTFIADELPQQPLSGLMDMDLSERAAGMKQQLEEGKGQLVGKEHSLLMISTSLPLEGEETIRWIDTLQASLADTMTGETYLIGNSPMNVEMRGSFGRERLQIEILTAAAIFLVVAFTFRNLVIPVLLVSLVQAGVFLTIMTTWLIGYPIYFLAVVIVQCILMGAMVDYAILYTNYYREQRRSMLPAEAMRVSYEKSVPTIMTSALFMILVTGVIGNSPADPTIGQICLTISIGAACATLLIIFVLPGVLAALDRYI